MQLDVQLFFQASFTLSSQCRLLEAKAIAADQVSEICSNINIGIMSLELLLKQLSELPAGDLSTLEILKKLSSNSTDIAFTSAIGLFKDYFHFDDIKSEMGNLGKSLIAQPVQSHIDDFDEELQRIVQLITVKEKTSGDVLNPVSSDANPLLDNTTAKAFQEIITIGGASIAWGSKSCKTLGKLSLEWQTGQDQVIPTFCRIIILTIIDFCSP